MFIDFEKWHGCKNDFVILRIDANENYTFDSLRRQAPAICNRDGSGIGADGIICLHLPPGEYIVPEKLSIINSDGSLAETCGNGIRCAAGSVLRRADIEGKSIPEDLNFYLDSGEVSVRTLGKIPNNKTPLLAVSMGTPTLNDENTWHSEAEAAIRRIISNNKLKLQVSEIGTCQILNRHIVVFCDGLSTDDLRIIGPKVQNAGVWDGINVHLVVEGKLTDDERAHTGSALGEAIEEKYDVLVWERGAGETAACGSGACAIAACVLMTGMSSRESWIQIQMPGGPLYVKQRDEDDPITLAGPAQYCFEGKIEI